MSKLSTHVACAALAACASLVTLAIGTGPAHAGVEPEAVTPADQSIVVIGSTGETLLVNTRSDRDLIAGGYQLSDGRLLTLRSRGGLVVAQLDGHPTTVLRPSGAARLASADDRMSVQFQRDRHDEVTVTVSLAVDGRTQTLAAVSARRRDR